MSSTLVLTRSELIEFASQYLGYPSMHYRSPAQGMDESGFDCSGYIRFLMDRKGIPADPSIRHCVDFFDRFGITIHEQAAGCGDLVFFSRDGVRPTHIGIVKSRREYIHAPGVENSSVEIAPIIRGAIEWRGKAERIYFQNPIGYKRIAVLDGRYQYPLPP